MAPPKVFIPKGTFPDNCYQSPGPCGEPLLTHTSTRDPPTLAGSFDSVSCGVTVLFLWDLVHSRLGLCPPRLESVFPGLWKSYNQIPLAFKVRFLEDSQSLCRVLRLRSLMWGSKPSQQWERFFGIVFQFMGHDSVGMRFDFIMIMPLLPSHCDFLFLELGYLCLVGSSVLLLMVLQ